MTTKQKTTPKSIDLMPVKLEDTIKIAVSTIVIAAACWIALKMSKEMLKELEGMGL